MPKTNKLTPKTKKVRVVKTHPAKIEEVTTTKTVSVFPKSFSTSKYFIALAVLLVFGFVGGVFLALRSNQIDKQDLRISSNPVFERDQEIPQPNTPEITNSIPETDNNSGASDTAIFTVEIKDPDSLSTRN